MKGEPVVFWGSVGLLIGMILQRFIPDVSSEFVGVLVDVVSMAGPAIGGLLYARSQVTPVANPVDKEGTSLVPITEVRDAVYGVGPGSMRSKVAVTIPDGWQPVVQSDAKEGR